MPTLPLYTPNPAHPNASHGVLAPCGYERWCFDAESDAGDVRIVATFSQGARDHPGYAEYQRRYRRYRRLPTRRRPPVPAELACVSLWVYRAGAAPVQFTRPCEPGEFRAAADRLELSAAGGGVAEQQDGAVRLRLADAVQAGPSATAADLVFRPVRRDVPSDLPVSPGRDGSIHHWILESSVCEVEGTIGVAGGAGASFSGRGYHDHHFGTAPVGRWLRGRVLGGGNLAAFHFAAAEAPKAGARRYAVEAQYVQADADGVRDVNARVDIDWSRYPTFMEFESVGMKLTRPRLLDGEGPVRRIVYDASARASSGLDGRTALCEWV